MITLIETFVGLVDDLDGDTAYISLRSTANRDEFCGDCEHSKIGFTPVGHVFKVRVYEKDDGTTEVRVARQAYQKWTQEMLDDLHKKTLADPEWMNKPGILDDDRGTPEEIAKATEENFKNFSKDTHHG